MSHQLLSKDVRELSDDVVTYLKRNGRSSSVIPKVQRLFSKVTAQEKRGRTAIVESSIALAPAEKKTLEASLAKVFGHEMSVQNVVTPEALGGLRIQVGDWVVDTTIASQLSQLAMQLTT